jgi:type IV pilus assembly protein PilE
MVFQGVVARTGRVRGFTLIELMITVAIVALLASLAYPAYTGSILKGRRAEGRTALIELLQQQERYLTQSGSYMSFAAGATGTNGTTRDGSSITIPFRTTSGTNAGSSAYDLAAAACPAASGAMGLNECVLLTAQPRGADPDAGNLTMQSTGAKGCSGSKPSVCWK